MHAKIGECLMTTDIFIFHPPLSLLTIWLLLTPLLDVIVEQKLRPITLQRPAVLHPVLNVPLLEYTIEWLACNQIDEVNVVK